MLTIACICSKTFSISITSLICGYNSGTVINCQVNEAAVEIRTGRGGGIVGFNENGIVSDCQIVFSSIACYQSFSKVGLEGYGNGHYAYIGGIVGHIKGGTISNCTVASNVDVDYIGNSNSDLNLAPEMGNLIGRKQEAVTMSGNTTNNNTSSGSLKSFKYSCGKDFWWWSCCYDGPQHTHNQSMYVSSADNGDTGRVK